MILTLFLGKQNLWYYYAKNSLPILRFQLQEGGEGVLMTLICPAILITLQ